MTSTQVRHEIITIANAIVEDKGTCPSDLIMASIMFKRAAEQLHKEAEVRMRGWKGLYL